MWWFHPVELSRTEFDNVEISLEVSARKVI
jgi:hypothetical protein